MILNLLYTSVPVLSILSAIPEITTKGALHYNLVSRTYQLHHIIFYPSINGSCLMSFISNVPTVITILTEKIDHTVKSVNSPFDETNIWQYLYSYDWQPLTWGGNVLRV